MARPDQNGNGSRALVSDERTFGHDRGRPTSIPSTHSASESSSETPCSTNTMLCRGSRGKLRCSPRAAPQGRESTRRTMAVGTNECLHIGTQHRKPTTRPRLNRTWTLIEEECRGGRRCTKQGSNQPLQTDHHSCVLTYDMIEPTRPQKTTVVHGENIDRLREHGSPTMRRTDTKTIQ